MTLHAHLHFESSDCDGRWEHDRKEGMTDEERTSFSFGDLGFKERIVRDVINVVATRGKLGIEEWGMTWTEETEEGFRHTRVEWCEANC